MAVSAETFELLEQQFKDIISEFQTLLTNQSHLRNALRAEAARAEAAEAARDAALRASEESQASAAAAAAGSAQATRAFAAAQDELVTVKMQFELVDKQRALFEANYLEVNCKLNEAERELQQLRPLVTTQKNLERQYIDLHQRIQKTAEDAANASSLLEVELRRVSRCADGGAEVRERARLAAAAHVRDRRLAADEMKHCTGELEAARAEIARLTTVIIELEYQLSNREERKTNKIENIDETADLRAALEAERNSTTRLGKTLAAALADNATLAAQLHNNDNDSEVKRSSPDNSLFIHDCPIDSFLAE